MTGGLRARTPTETGRFWHGRTAATCAAPLSAYGARARDVTVGLAEIAARVLPAAAGPA